MGNPTFQLSARFRRRLGAAFGLSIPADALVFMDYHLDWIYAALVLASEGDGPVAHPNHEGLVSGNQEDVDLLVAFADGPTVRLLLIEAKAETGWTNSQTASKARRLSLLFGADGGRFPGVTPHFALMSPRPPQQLNIAAWPSWMRPDEAPLWLELPVPAGRRQVVRCDAGGHITADGGHFRLR